MHDNVYTVEEAAKKIGITVKDVQDAILSGILMAERSQNTGAYLISHEHLIQYMKLINDTTTLKGSERKRVLVIDDEVRFAELVKLQLEMDKRLEVKTATNGKDGLRYIEQFVPHLLLLDFMLPDINGDQVIQAVSRMRKAPKPKIIVYSAHAAEIVQKMPDLEQRLTSMGADEFISKQDGTKALMRRVYEMLGLERGTQIIKKSQSAPPSP